MGTVHLTQGHHSLFIRSGVVDTSRRVTLERDLLSHPILDDCGRPMDVLQQDLVRAALHALADMPQFNAAVSYMVIEVNGVAHLAQPERVWGEITVGELSNVVVGFSHDSRRHNCAYRVLPQWLEELNPDRGAEEQKYRSFLTEWAAVEKWQEFFLSRIRREIGNLRRVAHRLELEQMKKEELADELERLLE